MRYGPTVKSYPEMGWTLWRVVRAAWCLIAGHTTQVERDDLYPGCGVTCCRCRRFFRVV